MQAHQHHALRAILEAAAQGVSADNGQPWVFRWRQGRLSVFLDKARAQSFFDWDHCAAYLGLGSVLENIDIAASHWGYHADFELFPSKELDGSSPVAAIAFTAMAARPQLLYSVIKARVTTRRPYTTQDVSKEASEALNDAIDPSHGFRVILVVSEALKRALATLTARADQIRFDFSRREVHGDFFRHLRYTYEEAARKGDGLWVDCLELGSSGKMALRLLAEWRWAAALSQLGLGRFFAGHSARLLNRTPMLGLIVASSLQPQKESDRQTWLLGGRVCQRLWLTATAHNLACQPMAVLPLFFAQHRRHGIGGFPSGAGRTVATLEQEFRQTFALAPSEQLIMMFRLGHAPPPSARSFRRPLEDLLAIEDNSPFTSSPRV